MKHWQHWATPKYILDLIVEFNGGPIGLDPCANENSKTGIVNHCVDDDGTLKPWTEQGLVYVNPPYNTRDIKDFARKIYSEAMMGAEIIALLPASTDTLWMQYHIFPRASAICFIRGRIKFDNPPPGKSNNAPKVKNLIAYFGKRNEEFVKTFASIGTIFLGR